ncbi:transporter substrate-binding domain-containing protein [Bifidobacterium imperatoris]|uniref:ABC transporter substrate-binding protein n=1 Tax=Bifidobacterium imperatoris TaxID=2020965 RepID=A0A2N5IRD3_9BIFI|nr:transporter substrate-binding domain-containing protein [Bifidobacterium imperatoris]PLS24505.1 ABC transporter substrate-binding protein [Bifidobacterium imperatoris]QSY57554.1 transporter substrate-binding domain-containing protein [Bifidobacterium imperatoris]
MRIKRTIAASAAAVMMAMPLSGCGQIQVTTVSGSPEGPTIAIGVTADEPAIGVWHDGTYEGFDVTVAKYVAARLGYANKQIVFKQVRPETRQSMLDNGQVDMVVASWPITGQSRAAVDFAGPYLTASVGLLVRASDRADYENGNGTVGDVSQRDICAVQGDETASLFQMNHPEANMQERDSYAQCVTALQAGSADAIVADTAILGGLRQANGPQYTAVLTDQGTIEYGIAVGKGTAELAGKIAEALQNMIDDGSWAAARDELKQQSKLSVKLNGTPQAIVSDDE